MLFSHTFVCLQRARRPSTPRMENEIIYSTVVFSKKDGAPENGKEAACSRFAALLACSGTLCVLLAASVTVVVYLGSVMKEQEANLSRLNAEKQLLLEERSILSSVTHHLNWTLGVIMHHHAFPVVDFCPDKKCQPCRKYWVLFQEKCYLFPPGEQLPWNTWGDSRRFCQNAAADLVVIDNLQELEFISNHTKFYHDQYHGYWLGLRKVEDTNWVWVDGRNYTVGSRSTKDIGTSLRCGLMVPERKPSASWSPADCYMRNKFICEADALIRSDL
ncbi:C-type lectin domain family 4 member A isoform X2 [Gasterosteus aculeatus]